MSEPRPRVLLIGYGNPGRLDDGLGPALAEAMERRRLPGVTVDADYQLTVEDAAAVASHDVVVFADAAEDGPEPLGFRRIAPEMAVSFSTHSVSPQAVLGMAHGMFAARTAGYLLGIRGYAFNEFGERLSEKARANLAAAVAFTERLLHTGGFDEAADTTNNQTTAGTPPAHEDEPCRTEST